jgi:malate dehydrogenase (oxaloacetate-decarboxylating)(NADP+)
MGRKEDALEYHRRGRHGKIEVVSSKPLVSQGDLSLAYTPGVAEPCLAIAKDPDASWEYTARGNLVAVISNGTAVLGLGNIGPAAGKPVMEGKACLFKKFADIDVFDLEIAENDVDKLVDIIASLEPTFGGINLEDISAPACFDVEEKLRARLSIPVFHDDQHGTAIISGAGLLNAAELAGKPLGAIKLVVSGAGAAAIACVDFFISLGVDPANVTLCDSKGVLHAGRDDLNRHKRRFARADDGRRTLADALVGADMFMGLSVAGLVTPAMLQTMAPHPIIFAMANPDPEIGYPEAVAARPDALVATGRSDYPNQVNNVLGFPYIFRGALDVRARSVTEPMKVAAARALAALAKEPVPESVVAAYGGKTLKLGPEYFIPKPFDPRVLWWVAPAVAEAAMASGVARVPVDVGEYRDKLMRRSSNAAFSIMRSMNKTARRDPRRIVFPEAGNLRVLRAVQQILDEEIARPVLLGRRAEIEGLCPRRLAVDPRSRDADRPQRAGLRRRRRALRAAPDRAARAQGRDPAPGAQPDAPEQLLRRDDARAGRRRRPGRRLQAQLPRQRAAGVAGAGPGARRAGRGRHVHDGAAELGEVLRRHGVHRRADRRAARRHRGADGRRGGRLRRHAAGGDDLVLQLRLGPASGRRAGAGGGRSSWCGPAAPSWRSTARCSRRWRSTRPAAARPTRSRR